MDSLLLLKAIRSALEINSKSAAIQLKMHFVHAGDYYWEHEDTFRSLILEGMKRYKIKSVMMTSVDMWRQNMITKEKMEKTYQGKEDTHRKKSVNDDLESFLEDLRCGKEPDETVSTYFLPKLTEEELELVERKDRSFLRTFELRDPRVKKAESMLSESDSRFVYGLSWRKTFTIEDSL